MSYTKVFELLGDNIKMKNFITNLSSGYLDIPNIISETLNILSDENSKIYSYISESNRKALCSMLEQYFVDCWSLYIEDLQLDKLLQYGKIEVYKVDAANGLRYATTNEIAQGVKNLISEYVYPAGEDAYKKLCLLQWTFCGRSYYYRQAGYKLDYDKDGKVINSYYDLIQTCRFQLKELIEWVSDRDNIDNALKTIKKMKKSKGYKYSSFEKDEITEDISIKQLLLNILTAFPKNSLEINYRRAIALALDGTKNNKRLSPMDISFLRNVYDTHALDLNRYKRIKEGDNQELKDQCELLLNERYKGKINHNHFAYKIIETLKKYNYAKCSPKQYAILEDALKIIDNKPDENDNNNTTEVISDDDIDMSLQRLSDAIGDGFFEDCEE